MRLKGEESFEFGGFQSPSDGWHRCSVQEPIDLMKKDGELVVSKFGGWNRLIVPLMVDEGSEEDGRKGQIILDYKSDKSEQVLANIIASCGMYKKFEQAYPGEVSLWDDGPFTSVKTKLPNKFMDIKFETSKDGKYVNVVAFQMVGMPRDEKAKSAKKEKAKAAPPAGAAAPSVAASDDWA